MMSNVRERVLRCPRAAGGPRDPPQLALLDSQRDGYPCAAFHGRFMGDFKLLIVGLILSTASDTEFGCCSQEYIPGGSDQAASTAPLTQLPGNTSPTGPATSSSSQSTPGVGTEPGPSDEVCTPGARRACNQDANGQNIPFPVFPPVGRCRLGEQECNILGKWEPCQGAIAPLDKDDCNMPEDDSDCDGTPNKGCECVAVKQSERPCGSEIGACTKGKQFCRNGVWGDCIGNTVPTSEACDGNSLDKDCDGTVDLRDSSCECLTSDAPQTCTIPNKKGDCSLGIKTCNAGQWSACHPRFFPVDEKCGARTPDKYGPPTGDEDCDGQVDEPDATKENNPWPLGCRYFMVDADQDGYGAIGPSLLENPKSPTWGCFCSKPIHLPGLVEASGEDKVDKDCGECDPEVPNHAYPYPKTTGSQCLKDLNWIGGAFDYDCSKKTEPRYIGFAQATCSLHFSGECIMKRTQHGFWYIPEDQPRKIPQCGEKGLGGIYCEKGETESGISTCTLAWHEVEQACH